MRWSTVICMTATAALSVTTSQARQNSESRTAIYTQLGLTPETVTVLGMNTAETIAGITRLDEQESPLQQYEQQVNQRQTLMHHRQVAKSNIRQLESVTDQQQAEQAIADIDAQIVSLTGSIKNLEHQLLAVFFGAPYSSQIERVCNPSGLTRMIPAEYRVVELLPEQESELYAALLAEERAMASSEAVGTETQLILNSYRNMPAVLQARSDLMYNLDAVRGAFSN